MANRIPLIVDTGDGNKIKELPIGDNLNLTGSGIVGAGSISATSLTINNVPYNPFSGAYADLTGKPTIPATTDDITEGTKKFYTDERVDDRISNLFQAGTGITLQYNDASNLMTISATGGGSGGSSTLAGLTDTTIVAPLTNQYIKWNGSAFVNSAIAYTDISGTPNLDNVATSGSYLDLSNKPSIPNDIGDLTDVDTTSTAPTSGQVLKWSGTQWAPADDITSGGGGLNADTLDGFDSTYYLNFNNLNNKPTYGQNDLNDTTIGGNLATGHLLQYNGSAWVNIDFQPNFSIIQNTPTTLAGYGITDSPTNLTDLGGISSPSGADKLLASTGTPNTYAWQTTLNGISITAAGTIQFANGTSINEFSTDTTLSGNSDDAVPTEKATKSYVDTSIAGISVDGLESRSTITTTTNSIATGVTENKNLTGFKAYGLMSITVNNAAWVRVYTNSAKRTADASRSEGTDPAADSGVIAEVITTASGTVDFAPAIVGYNNDATVGTDFYVAITNKSAGTATIEASFKILKLES